MTSIREFLGYIEDVAENFVAGPFDDITLYDGCEPQDDPENIPVNSADVIATATICLRNDDGKDIEDSPVCWVNVWLTQSGLVYRYFLWNNPVEEVDMFEPVTIVANQKDCKRSLGPIQVPTAKELARRVVSRTAEWIVKFDESVIDAEQYAKED
jgi:hypothetical protein